VVVRGVDGLGWRWYEVLGVEAGGDMVGGRGWEGCGGDSGVCGIGARFGEGPRPRFLLGWSGIPYCASRQPLIPTPR